MKRFWGLNYINMGVGVLFAILGLYLERYVIVALSCIIVAIGIWMKLRSEALCYPEKRMWKNYISQYPDEKKSKYTAWHYGNDEKTANVWADKVKNSEITAVSYCTASFSHENFQVPDAGEYSIILDWQNQPVCIIRTKGTSICAFHEVDDQMARKEGFLDQVQWQAVHRKIFKKICESLRKTFTEEQTVLFEQFEVVYKE